MAARYLLDTDTVSELIRQPHGAVAEQVRRVGGQDGCARMIVAAELRYGAHKSGSPTLGERVEAMLTAIPVLPLEPPTDTLYANIRDRLTRRGQKIGPNDLLIAAHGLALDKTVVTANDREFGRTPGLAIENWVRSPG